MPKKIFSHRKLSIRWRSDANCFQLDLRPIGGGHKNFKTKAEANQQAKDMFEIWEAGKPATEIKPWTVEKGIEHYIANAERRVADIDDNYGPCSFTTQKCDLNNCAKLTFDGLALAKRNVADLDIDFIEQEFWPELKRNSNTSVTELNRFRAFRQMMFYCIKRKQITVNVCSKADIPKPNRVDLWHNKVKKSMAKVNPDNLQLILDNVLPQHKLKVLFALETGLRIGEQVTVKIFDPKKPELGSINFKTIQVRPSQCQRATLS